MTLRPLLPLLAALALLAAGCGGDGGGDELSTEEFEQQLSDAQTRVESAFGSISAGDVTDPAALSDRIEETATELREIADELREQNVPDEAEEPTERLVDNLGEFADELEDVAASIEEGGTANIIDAARDLQNSDAARQVQQALEDLQAAGFDVGGAGGG